VSNLSSSRPENRRRSERVMLQIPVTVVADDPTGKAVREETNTLVVNAHGGLMKLKTEVVVGQPIVLINPRTKMEANARVVRVDEPPGGVSAVAFEFDEPAPQFWPVVFPPADWGAPRS
jgi:hypothetical protein